MQSEISNTMEHTRATCFPLRSNAGSFRDEARVEALRQQLQTAFLSQIKFAVKDDALVRK